MVIAVVALLIIAGFAAIAYPLLRGGGAPGSTDAMSDAPVEAEVARYRAALRSNTVCSRCGQANPQDSRYCYECGRALAAADDVEFEGTGEDA